MKNFIWKMTILILMLMIVSYSQDQESDKIEKEIKYSGVLSNPQDLNFSLDQLGNANSQQLIQNEAFVGNYAQMVQYGNSNYAKITQEGEKNVSYLFQIGNSNESELNLLGDYNTTIGVQVGNSNSIEQELLGSSRFYYVEQFGNDNGIIQLENSSNSVPFSIIRQRGNGMQIRIINGGIVK